MLLLYPLFQGALKASRLKQYTGCFNVIVTSIVSESIESSKAKNEEADVLHMISQLLTSSERLSLFHLVVNLLPFNEGVIEAEKKQLVTNMFTTREEFLDDVDDDLQAIQQDIRQGRMYQYNSNAYINCSTDI